MTKSYPWYTPYQFAGNKPIVCIDLDGAEEKNAVERFLGYTVDMSKAPTSYKGVSGRVVQTTYNLHGYPVNYLYFWETNIKEHPEFLDPWNQERVLVQGKAPIFTKALKAHLDGLGVNTEGLKIGDILEHHHINQGRTAVPITESVHDEIPVQKNPPGVRVNPRFGKFLSKGLGVIGPVMDALGLFSQNPDSWINSLGSQNSVGVVYKHQETGLYYTIVSQQKGESSGTSRFFIYTSYDWDREKGKFVGVNPIGYGEQYDEKSGYSRTITYDMQGNLQSMTEKGMSVEKGKL